MDMLPPMLLMRVPKKEESKGSVHELPCSRPRENGSNTNLRERFRDRPHHFPGEARGGEGEGRLQWQIGGDRCGEMFNSCVVKCDAVGG